MALARAIGAQRRPYYGVTLGRDEGRALRLGDPVIHLGGSAIGPTLGHCEEVVRGCGEEGSGTLVRGCYVDAEHHSSYAATPLIAASGLAAALTLRALRGAPIESMERNGSVICGPNDRIRKAEVAVLQGMHTLWITSKVQEAAERGQHSKAPEMCTQVRYDARTLNGMDVRYVYFLRGE